MTLDKDCAKTLVAAAGLAVPASVLLRPEQPLEHVPRERLKFPLVVKPAWEGSSKGIRNRCLVESFAGLPPVVAALRRDHPQPILLEEYIAGAEVTVGILGTGETGEPAGNSDHKCFDQQLAYDPRAIGAERHKEERGEGAGSGGHRPRIHVRSGPRSMSEGTIVSRVELSGSPDIMIQGRALPRSAP